MLEEGVYLALLLLKLALFLVPHSEADIQATLDAAERVFARLKLIRLLTRDFSQTNTRI